METTFEIDKIYGYFELRTWFEFDGTNLIGMGSKKEYDQNGKLVEYSEEPTGIILKWK